MEEKRTSVPINMNAMIPFEQRCPSKEPSDIQTNIDKLSQGNPPTTPVAFHKYPQRLHRRLSYNLVCLRVNQPFQTIVRKFVIRLSHIGLAERLSLPIVVNHFPTSANKLHSSASPPATS
jgi:hypothetical protein